MKQRRWREERVERCPFLSSFSPSFLSLTFFLFRKLA